MANIKDVKAALEALQESEGDYYLGEFVWNIQSNPQLIEFDGKSITLTHVDSKPGAEGGGENIWLVFHAGDETLYRISGYYGSYDGEEWDLDSLEEVVAETYQAVRYNSVS